MRLVQVLVPDDRREAVTSVLDEERIDHVRQRAVVDGEEEWLVEFPIPTDAIAYVLDRLADAGVERERYTVIATVEAAMTPHAEQLEERFAEDFDPLTRPELRSKARDMSQDPRSFVAMIVLSAILATAGLLTESPAIVVGSMVIAPIVGPVLTASVGAVTGDREMVLASVRLQSIGVVVAVVAAAVLGLGLQFAGVVPGNLDVTAIDLVAVRIAPSLLTVAVGLAAGGAAAFGLTTKGPTSVIGVMIAAALIPAAATAGIAVAWDEFRIAVGSLLLVALTLVLINAAAIAVLWHFEYRPARGGGFLESAPIDRRVVLVATVIVVVVLSGLVGAITAQQVAFERTVAGEVETTFDRPEYDALDPVTVRVEYAGVGRFEAPATVTVTASRTGGDDPPDVATALSRRIADATDRAVTVRVRFVEYQQQA